MTPPNTNPTSLREIIQNIRDDAIAEHKGWQGSPYEAEAAILKHFEQIVERAKPEISCLEHYSEIEKHLDQYEQNLKELLKLS